MTIVYYNVKPSQVTPDEPHPGWYWVGPEYDHPSGPHPSLAAARRDAEAAATTTTPPETEGAP